MGKRTSLTRKERTAMLLAQGGVCAQCGGAGPFDADHSDPVALGNEAKPDRMICRRRCHLRKTAIDRKAIAKMAHLHLKTGQQARRARRKENGRRPLLPTKPFQAGRGFDKRLKKKMDGTVVRAAVLDKGEMM